MSERDDGGPAFPFPDTYDQFGNGLREGSIGMTLRDWFAGQALAGYIANPDTANSNSGTVARDCYHIADAFIAERSKKNPTP